MFEQRVSGRYARSLLMTALALGLEDKVYEDMQYINTVVCKSKELKALTLSPVIQHWRKKNAFEEIFKDKVNKLTLEFLFLLTKKKRELIIDSIIYQYECQYNTLKKRQKAEIFSAVELSDELRNDIVKRLSDMTKKTILPKYIVEPSIKGGLMIQIGDWVYDASIKNQLDTLHDRLIETIKN